MRHYSHLSVLAVILLAALFSACDGNKGFERTAPPAVPVTVYEVKSGNAVYYDEYPATVTALNQVDIRPEVSGYIKGVYFKDGQHVQNGAKLYAIDQQPYLAAYHQAVANLNIAKANLARAQDDAKRYNDLAKNDAVARQTLDHALSDLRASEMQVAAAEANVRNVQTNLRYSVIYAPFGGTIGISAVKLGSAVVAGQTLLNIVSSDDPIGVDCSVDEKEIGRFTELLQKSPAEQDSIFTIIMPDQSVYPNPGRLNVMDRAVDPETGSIRIRVSFPNPRNLLRPGMTCDLRVKSGSTNNLLIPYKAVIEQMGEYFVFVVHGNKVSQQRVRLGMNINGLVVVNEGLSEGEQIVTDGVQKLRDNSTIAALSAGAGQGIAVARPK
jgi:RND family efflux transporter MFP subunit